MTSRRRALNTLFLGDLLVVLLWVQAGPHGSHSTNGLGTAGGGLVAWHPEEWIMHAQHAKVCPKRILLSLLKKISFAYTSGMRSCRLSLSTRPLLSPFLLRAL